MTDETNTLSDTLIAEMTALKETGDKFAKRGDYQKAIEFYQKAYEQLPAPREGWEAATWILGIIGDAYFLDRKYSKAFAVLNQALLAPGAIGNPFIHLRLGQCALELGDESRSKDELMRAYMGAGEDIFLHDNPKYLEFLAKHADIQVSKLRRRKTARD
jgi:tetratricopeptide (TPR) repeat protein